MRIAQIANGVVVNVFEGTEIQTSSHVPSATANIGDIYEGGVFKSPVPDVPPIITRRQGRLALIDAGKLLAVEAHIDAIEDDTERLKARVEYEVDKWERSNPWLNQMGTLLGLTQEDIDGLFKLAASKQ